MLVSVIILTGVGAWLLGGFMSYTFLLVPLIAAISRRKLNKLKKAMKEEQAMAQKEVIIQDGI